jgi:RHS repeat-associated protein
LDSYGQDPRRIAYAGSEVDGASIDFAEKYRQSQQTIKDRYADFEVPYNGKDNDDYVNGGGFCCDDAPQLRAGTNDNPELYQYYYHSDHLGSTSLITNLDGEIVQHVEYVPFGEVFIEERNNTWNTPYLFNAKELDEETGLYYYGARYYDPRTSVFLGVDPMWEKYPGISSYAYCVNNPVKYTDPTGKYIESVWDIASLATGVGSFIDNLKAGNVGAAVVDGLGVIVDAAAVALPVIPGGAGAAIKGVRAVDKAVDAVKAVDKATDVKKVSTITENAAKGKAFEKQVGESLGGNKASQVTIEAADGTRTKVDFA